MPALAVVVPAAAAGDAASPGPHPRARHPRREGSKLPPGFVALVTGASSGIGLATAEGLAGMGATVAMVCRSRERGEAARSTILSALAEREPEEPVKEREARLQVWRCDLASHAQVRDLAARFAQAHDRLDVLVNNAGGLVRERTITEDGHEATMAVNHLAPFLLTHEVLPLLRVAARASGEARVVGVASGMHWASMGLDPDDLDRKRRRYRSFPAYDDAKLANVLFARELARRLRASGPAIPEHARITANCCHPGVVHTGFFQHGAWWVRWAGVVLGPFLASPERAARTVLHLAASPTVRGVSGQYYVRRRRGLVSPRAKDGDLAKALWRASARATGVDPEALGPA